MWLGRGADHSQANQLDMSRARAVGHLAKDAPDEEVVRVIRSAFRY
jgi:hypothetical protein